MSRQTQPGPLEDKGACSKGWFKQVSALLFCEQLSRHLAQSRFLLPAFPELACEGSTTSEPSQGPCILCACTLANVHARARACTCVRVEIFSTRNLDYGHLCFLVLVFFGVFLPAVDQLSVPPRKRICNTKKIEGDNITGRLRAV